MGDDTIRIVPATAADIPLLVELWKEFMDFHVEGNPFFRRRVDAHENWVEFVRGRLTEDPYTMFIAWDGAVPVGFCSAADMEYPPVFESRRYGYILDMAVTAAYRRRGIASRLYREAERWLLARGLERIELKVDAGNATSQGFWRRMGFGVHTETWTKTRKAEA